MARIRTIKPEFWTHEALSDLPAEVHMLAAALLNHADDDGYFNAHPKLIQSACFPLRVLSVSIQGALSDLSKAGYLRLGNGADGRHYGHIINFLEHQVINRPTASKIKDLEIVWEQSVSFHGVLTEDSSGKGKEGKGTGNREQGTGKGTGNGARARSNPIRDALLTVLDEEHADAVIEHRKSLKAQLTVRAAQLLAKAFATAPYPNVAADTMIERGWRGFKLEWTKGQTPRPHSRDDGETRMGGMKIKFR